MRDPGSIARYQHGFQRGHQSACRHNHFRAAITLYVHVWFTIGNYEERFAFQFTAQANAQPFRGPHRGVRLAKLRFFRSRGPCRA